MNEQRMQFAIGIVTLIAGFALAAIIIWFGEFQFVLQPRKIYYATFTSAPGAEAKVPVRRAGIRIGEVLDVEYSEEHSLVVLTFVVEGDNQLREGDEPTLRATFLGDSFLDIETNFEMRGKKDRPLIPAGSLIEGRSPPDTNQALQRATNLVPTADRTLTDFQDTARQWTQVGNSANRLLDDNRERVDAIVVQTQESLERLAQTLDRVNNVLSAEAQENLHLTLKNLRESSEDLKPMIEASRKTIDQISNTTQKLDEIAINLQQATKPLAERSESTVRNLDESAASLNLLLADLRVLSNRLNTQDGSLQRLISDASLYQKLDDAAFLLVRNLGELEKVLADARVFADKIARHPGEIGVQGVLTKDSGLKEVEPGTLRRRGKMPLGN